MLIDGVYQPYYKDNPNSVDPREEALEIVMATSRSIDCLKN